MSRDRRKWIIPLLVVAGSVVAGAALMATGPQVEEQLPDPRIPAVRVVDAQPIAVQHRVRSQGTVVPRTESELIPEVAGRVVGVSPALVSGGFFEEGDVLLRIDRADHLAALGRAKAALARAEGEDEHARANLRRRQELAQKQISSDSLLEDARRAARVSAATLDEARISVDQAQRDLERTQVRAPFAGRVRGKQVDVGQFLNRGTPIATLYATDYVEVRLPLPDRELAYLDLPLGGGEGPGPEVTLRARFAGGDHAWRGRVVRTEGEIDARTRMVHVVARVEAPYAPDPSGRPPLAVGLFVQAEIEGSMVEDILVVPRTAVRDTGELLVVDTHDTLQLRAARVVRTDREDVLVRATLQPGDRVCVTPLQAFVAGMRVQPVVTAAEAASPRDAS